MARTINAPTTLKPKSPTCNACPTACATACTTAPRARESKSVFANAWKKSNDSKRRHQIGRQIGRLARQKAEQKENLKPDFRDLIQQLQSTGRRVLSWPPARSRISAYQLNIHLKARLSG